MNRDDEELTGSEDPSVLYSVVANLPPRQAYKEGKHCRVQRRVSSTGGENENIPLPVDEYSTKRLFLCSLVSLGSREPCLTAAVAERERELAYKQSETLLRRVCQVR